MFINRYIDELLAFIKELLPKRKESVEFTPEQIVRKIKTNLEISVEVENGLIMLPKRSDDGDMLLVTVDSAEVQTFMDTIKFKNPTTFDATIDIVKGKMAIWEPIEERDFLCTIASVVAKGAKIWIEVNK